MTKVRARRKSFPNKQQGSWASLFKSNLNALEMCCFLSNCISVKSHRKLVSGIKMAAASTLMCSRGGNFAPDVSSGLAHVLSFLFRENERLQRALVFSPSAQVVYLAHDAVW
ncbi:hypothetical protein CDAR_541521 [Caerostris darwini]|uniref:Uncharacterized protein n=1 Tax=Caerostris darwini TaxID=1538125 RepID=A0AAV4UUM7_9ARAC|nr:hypothetical protein CDAR_541521 [Caerostris darwini]